MNAGPGVALVLLDLDETLLPTTTLQDTRHSRTPLPLRRVPAYRVIQLNSGIRDALSTLVASVRLGLVTSSPRWYVEQILDDHLPGLDLSVVVTYDDVEHLKPDPEPLVTALSRAGTDAGAAVYVGDDLVDQVASAAAGVRFVGAGWATHPTYTAPVHALGSPPELAGIVGSPRW